MPNISKNTVDHSTGKSGYSVGGSSVWDSSTNSNVDFNPGVVAAMKAKMKDEVDKLNTQLSATLGQFLAASTECAFKQAQATAQQDDFTAIESGATAIGYGAQGGTGMRSSVQTAKQTSALETKMEPHQVKMRTIEEQEKSEVEMSTMQGGLTTPQAPTGTKSSEYKQAKREYDALKREHSNVKSDADSSTQIRNNGVMAIQTAATSASTFVGAHTKSDAVIQQTLVASNKDVADQLRDLKKEFQQTLDGVNSIDTSAMQHLIRG